MVQAISPSYLHVLPESHFTVFILRFIRAKTTIYDLTFVINVFSRCILGKSPNLHFNSSYISKVITLVTIEPGGLNMIK